MDNTADQTPRLELLIPAHAMGRFTTLLQAGFFVESSHGTTVGEFLHSLPGFTMQYITDRIETIFLNGLPVDDLTTVINGTHHPVLAVSAAMPGLAGAIFRKNSFHAALRTKARSAAIDPLQNPEKVLIILKLFNMVASERGGELLHHGCLMKTASLLKFIHCRPQLLAEILHCRCAGTSISPVDLPTHLQGADRVFLRIAESNASV